MDRAGNCILCLRCCRPHIVRLKVVRPLQSAMWILHHRSLHWCKTGMHPGGILCTRPRSWTANSLDASIQLCGRCPLAGREVWKLLWCSSNVAGLPSIGLHERASPLLAASESLVEAIARTSWCRRRHTYANGLCGWVSVPACSSPRPRTQRTQRHATSQQQRV